MADSTKVTIASRDFICVRLQDADFKDVAAVYVILCVSEDGSWKVLDVGQTGELGTRIDAHDRRECWEKHCPGKNIWVCVYPMPTSRYTKEERLQLESAIRNSYGAPCGKR